MSDRKSRQTTYAQTWIQDKQDFRNRIRWKIGSEEQSMMQKSQVGSVLSCALETERRSSVFSQQVRKGIDALWSVNRSEGASHKCCKEQIELSTHGTSTVFAQWTRIIQGC